MNSMYSKVFARGEDGAAVTVVQDPREMPFAPCFLPCPACGSDDVGTWGDTEDRTECNVADHYECNACKFYMRLDPAWDYEADKAVCQPSDARP